jgi:Flp pilus assembly protein TadD
MAKGRTGWQASGARHGIPVIAALLLLSLVVAPAWGQRGRGRLQGQVLDPEGNPVPGVEVSAFNAEMTPDTLTTTTDEEGRWAVLGLSNDTWKFTFRKDGYIPLEIDASVSGFGRNPNMDVTLEPYEAPVGGVDVGEVEGRALFEEGEALYEAGDYAGAIAKWEEFALVNPSFYQVFVNIGNAHKELGNHEEAIAAYEKVLERDPADSRALANLAEMLVLEGKPEEAIPLFERVVEQSPDDPAVFYNVAELYFQQRVTDKAIDFYKRALQVDPTFLPAQKQIGFAYINMNEIDLAIAAFEKFLETAPPDNPDIPLVQQVLDALRQG